MIKNNIYFQDIDINYFSLVKLESNGQNNGFDINFDDDEQSSIINTNENSITPKKKKRRKRSKKNDNNSNTSNIYKYS